MARIPGSPTTSTQRVQRNARVARARAEGRPWATISAREGLSVRQCARAAREHIEAAVAPPVSDPIDLAAFVVQTHLDSLTALARLSRSKNDPTALGASARAPAIAVSLLDVAGRVGLAPGPIGSWSFLRDLPSIAAALLAAAERAGARRDVLLRELGVGLDAIDAAELVGPMNLNTNPTEEN